MIFKTTTYEEDYKIATELCGRWWKDSLFYKTYGVEYKVHKPLFDAMYDMGALIYTIGYVDDEPAGCYIAIKQPYMFNPAYNMMTEIVWCLDEKYRGFRNLVALLNEIDRLGRESDCQLYSLAVSNEEEYNSLHRVLGSKNFTNMDHVFMRRIGGKDE